MSPIKFIVSLAFATALAGCAGFPSTPSSFAPVPGTDTATTSATPTAEFAASTIVQFLDPAAVERMSEREKSEAASAQYYALQFGRPGAPRLWSGDAGASGEVTVGPFVKVNLLDCRDFTHQVSIGNAEFPRSGTACREEGGDWAVVASN